MTRGQTLNKIKELGYIVSSLTINGTLYIAEKADIKFTANTPAGLLRQIKAGFNPN